MIVVDTNILIRYLTGDDPKKAEKFRDCLRSRRDLFISDVVVAETYFVLTSFYEFSRGQVLSWLIELIHHSSVKSNQALLDVAMEIALTNNVSFVDAYSAALARERADGQVMSYDRGLNRIAGIKRIEP